MPGLRDQFSHFHPLSDDDIANAMKTGLVVPDTNVLLRLYEFNATARDELLRSLENLRDRLWVPYQVGHEVNRKRLESIAKQERFFKEARGGLDSAFRAVRNQVGAFRTRLALSKDDLKGIEDGIGALQELIQAEVTKASRANDVRLGDRDSDKVLARLEQLFDNRVGIPMEPGELEEARKEAARRGREKIPPGYKDADKDKGDPAGDYLIWRQLLTEAKARKLPVVFITDDSKEDWYRVDQDIPLGARYELRVEMMREAGVPLLMITTAQFIDHAEKYLKARFSDETVEQAKELPDLRIEVKVPPAKPVYAGVEGLRKGLEVAYAGLSAQPSVTNIEVAAQVLLAAILVAEGLRDKGTEAGVRDTAIDAILRSPEDAPVIPSSEERQESDHEPPESDDDPPTDGQ